MASHLSFLVLPLAHLETTMSGKITTGTTGNTSSTHGVKHGAVPKNYPKGSTKKNPQSRQATELEDND